MLFIVFYIVWLGSYPVFTPDEGRYSEVAREMVATGDYITPRVNGVTFLDKPILYYWLQALAIRLFGLKEWTLRLFPALFGVLGCLVVYVFGRQLFDRRTGLLSAVILATTPLYFGCAHYANLDLEVAVLISSCLLSILTACQTTGPWQRYSFFASYCFAALAFLTKGLIAIAFPILITFVWIASLKRWNVFKKMNLAAGMFIFFILVLPWYLLVQWANPEFLHFFFVTQQVTRFLSTTPFNNSTPCWFYLPVILLGFLPWTFFLAPIIKQYWQNFRIHHKQHPTEWFLLLWISIIFIFFSIPHSKIAGYILPVFPALALLVGHYLSHDWQQRKLAPILCAAGSATFLFIVVWNAATLNDRTTKPLISELKSVIQPQDEVINYFKFYYDVPLYLEKQITLVADWNAADIETKDNWVRELWYGKSFQDTQDWLIDENTFWHRFESEKRVFVFLNDNYFTQFKSHAHHYFILGKFNDIILLSNKPTMLSKNP
jgi:4-amino-4-deoxy-L-arabinose transferase-like glycosyltransferase